MGLLPRPLRPAIDALREAANNGNGASGNGQDPCSRLSGFGPKRGDSVDLAIPVDNFDRNATCSMPEMHGAYAPKDPQEPAHFGVKVIVIDIPRPRRDIDWMPDVGPGQLPITTTPINGSNGSSGTGHKPQE